MRQRAWTALAAVSLLATIGCGREPASAESASPAADALAAETTDGSPGPLPSVTDTLPDGLGGELVFQSDIGGLPRIYHLALPGGVITPLTRGGDWRDETPRWSPGGDRILFSSNRTDPAEPGQAAANFDLYVMASDGTAITRLTSTPGNERDGSWAPDGRSIVYWSDGESRGDLYRLWLDDGRVERLTRNFVGRAIMPTVSPDGQRVAFASQTLRVGDFWNYQVQVLDLSTGRVEAVSDNGGTCWPVWFADGERLGYVQLEPEPSVIQRRALSGGPVDTLARLDGRWLYYPRVSPDQRWLAVSTSPEHHEGEDWDLAVVPLDGTGRVITLTAGAGNDRLPDWRPGLPNAAAAGPAPGGPSSGSPVVRPASFASATESTPATLESPPTGTLVFQSDRDGRDKLYTLDVASGTVRALTQGADYRDEEPAWSPDGQRIAFNTNRFNGRSFDIAVMDATGGQMTRVTDAAAFDQDPAWMPDGKSLVFTSEREGTGAIYSVRLADRHVERLSRTSDRAIMPAVSPDGTRVAYAVATANGFQIFVLDLASGVERQVTQVEEGACRPAWSRDGTRVAYVRMSGREASWLEAIELTTGRVSALLEPRGVWSYYPARSPDGRHLALSVSPEHHDGEDWDLAIIDPAAPEGFRRLTRGAGNDRVPDWKP